MTYAASQGAARRMLADKGQAIILTSSVAAAYDPATGTATVSASSVQTRGVVLPLARGLAHAAGTSIEATDRQMLLPGDIARPEIGATATIGGTDYTITEVSPLSPGGTVILYDCLIRGAP